MGKWVANRGIIGMKKTYIKITALICSLILVVMVLGIALFTHIQVSAENQRCLNSILFSMHDHMDGYNSVFDDFDSYMASYKGFQFFERTSDENIGYYGKCTWTWNQLHLTRTLESTDFQHGSAVISSAGSHILEVGFVDDGVEGSENFFVIIYRSATEASPDSSEEITEELELTDAKGMTTHVNYVPSDKNDMYPLDAEAKAKYDELCTTPGAMFRGDQLGWFTSYLAYDTTEELDNGKFTIRNEDVFVFHPFSTVVHNYMYVYILFFIVLIILQALTVFMMRRVYINRQNFEARTKNLTRSFAHELKTPLAVTKSYVENWDLVSEDERPAVSKKITYEVDHMTKMVNTLLDISKMDAGDFNLNLEDVELFDLTKVCFRHMEELARERNIEVDIKQDKEDGEYTVQADLDMMRMVISNFMCNAIKYGKTKVDVLLVDGSNNVTFKITNDGEPISKKDQKKIWDLFYKKDQSGSDRLTSSGVGLAVNKSILEIHKAKFGVESGAAGTTFWFEMKKAKE